MTQSTSLILAIAAPDVRMPELAPLVALAFLGTGCLVFAAAVGGAIALAFRKLAVARWIGASGLLAVSGYAALLLGAAFLSRERTLAPGEKKYFCELDCHLAYSVARASLGGASGRSRAVTIRTWFDPSTIASFRGNGPLSPNPRIVYLVDSGGRRFDPSPASQKAWDGEHGPTVPLTKALRPGESYETTLVFDLPDGAPGLRLFLGDPPGIENVLIGHENSPLHKKTYFALS